MSASARLTKSFASIPACGVQGEFASGCTWVAAERDCVETDTLKRRPAAETRGARGQSGVFTFAGVLTGHP